MVAEVVRWRWTEMDGFWEAKRGRYEGRGDGRMRSGRKESATAGGGFCWLGTLGVTLRCLGPITAPHALHSGSTWGPGCRTRDEGGPRIWQITVRKR